MLSERLNFCTDEFSLSLLKKTDEIGRMLNGLKTSLTNI